MRTGRGSPVTPRAGAGSTSGKEWGGGENLLCLYPRQPALGTLYVGITNDLIRRVHEHQSNTFPESFTAKHGIHSLVHFEVFDDPENAIRREKRLKEWQREWKINLIEHDNPHWDDLYPRLL